MSKGGVAGAGPNLDWDANEDGVSALPIHVIEDPTWEHVPEEGKIRLEMDAWDRPSILDDRVAHILEGLEAGEDLPGIVDRLVEAEAYPSRASAERNARNIVLGLAGQGNLEVRLPPVPDVFGDRFERVEELGRGAVGVVWLCEDVQTGDPVVVKHAWNWSGPLQRRDENLRKEAEMMRRLDHPGVVSFVDGLDVDGRFHLVREYVDGHDLADRILTEGPLPRDQRRNVAREAAEILAHLHGRSIWCMDLKPGNLMRRGHEQAPGRLVLADLGHCRAVEADRIELERVPGTRGYLGPEVFEDHAATVAIDTYGLGKLYEFLTTAYPPNQGEAIDEVLNRMEERGDPEPDELAFVEACLARDPDDRPAPLEAVGILEDG